MVGSLSTVQSESFDAPIRLSIGPKSANSLEGRRVTWGVKLFNRGVIYADCHLKFKILIPFDIFQTPGRWNLPWNTPCLGIESMLFALLALLWRTRLGLQESIYGFRKAVYLYQVWINNVFILKGSGNWKNIANPLFSLLSNSFGDTRKFTNHMLSIKYHYLLKK
jgi:hypothetical protein